MMRQVGGDRFAADTARVGDRRRSLARTNICFPISFTGEAG
jgi:hypothetical protein